MYFLGTEGAFFPLVLLFKLHFPLVTARGSGQMPPAGPLAPPLLSRYFGLSGFVAGHDAPNEVRGLLALAGGGYNQALIIA